MKLSERIEEFLQGNRTGSERIEDWAQFAEEVASLEAKVAKYDVIMAQQKTYYDVEAENGRLYRELQQAKAEVAALQKSLREADDMYVASDTDRRRAEDKLEQVHAYLKAYPEAQFSGLREIIREK